MPASSSRCPSRATGAVVLLLLAGLATGVGVPPGATIAAAIPPEHLVISEVVTGGASASDEFVEIHNPTDAALPLEGLELVYVSATGGTVTRRASWAAGAISVPARRHVLVANEAGIYAAIGDVLYAGGMAASGGSVALRIQGATTAIDAVGWGTATSTWLEGTPAPAPGAGESLERLPGGTSGSTVDTGDNASDFAVRPLPEPQNLTSAPTPDPTRPPSTPVPAPPDPTVGPTLPPPPVTPAPSPTDPGAVVTTVAAARAMPDGTVVTVEGVAMTTADFTDGGGYLADATGGIAILADAGAFARGRSLRVTGELDDRFGQRTIRVSSGDVADLGEGAEPDPLPTSTGGVAEAVEATLVRVVGTIVGSASTLSAGTAFDIDDGSGPVRLVIATATGIDVSGWRSATQLDLVGVVGQRDSTGTGSGGYRIQPRDPADLRAVGTPASPVPTPSVPATSGPPTPAPPSPRVITIAEARAASKNARVTVRGTVTLPTGVVDARTAAIQDASGAILLRLADEAGSLALGETVEVAGTRSTKSGMETLRITEPPRRVTGGTAPEPVQVATGHAAEAHEARLVTVRGGLMTSARRASTGTVSFEIDDGSGPLRVVAAAVLGVDREALLAGAWVEVSGVLGQETTGSLPTRGYRVWPRSAADVRIVAASTDDTGSEGGAGPRGAPGGAAAPSARLDDLDGAAARGLAVGATLVVAAWPEIGVGGLLWDGERLVGVLPADGARLQATLRGRPVPVPLELRDLTAAGTEPVLGLPLVTLGLDVDAVVPDVGVVAPPATAPPPVGSSARWVSVIGRLSGGGTPMRIETPGATIELEQRCDGHERHPRGSVVVVGIAVAGQPLVVPCGGIRSAPSLARATLAGAVATRPSEPARGVAPHAPGRSPSSTVAAGLLVAAALALAGAATWVRVRPPERPEAGTEEVDGLPEAAPPKAGAEPAPVLTLVRLPHERGP